MKMDKFSAGMLLGAAIIITGLFLTWAGYDAFFLVAGGVAALVSIAVRRWRRGDGPEKDERTDKIHAFGLAYSWLVSIILILVFFAAAKMGLISIDSTTALSIAIFIMTGSAIIMLIALYRRSDVDWS